MMTTRDDKMMVTSSSSNSVSTTAAVKNATTGKSMSSFFPQLSKTELEDLREAFRLFDTEGSGKISYSTLREVVQSLGVDENNDNNNNNHNTIFASRSYRHLHNTLNMKMNQSGNNDNVYEEEHYLDERDFIQLITSRPEGDNRDELRRLFDLFDSKGKGYITIDDLRAISSDLGENILDEELQEMMEKASPSSSGKVTSDEFRNIMTKKLFS